MKCEVIIDPQCEERVVIYARQNDPTVEEIKRITDRIDDGLLGYAGKEIVRLDPAQIQYVSVIGNKVYAVLADKKYILKDRLYVLEERLPDSFVKINQSCLANIRWMERFDTSISGSLKIRFKNGDTDYVSRRQLKAVKKRIGI